MWVGLLLTFLLQGAFDHSHKILPLAFVVSIIANIALAQIIAYSFDKELRTKKYYLIAIISLLLASVISYFSDSFLLEALPICLAVSYPLFQVTIENLTNKNKIKHTRFLNVIVLIGALHTVDYAFLRLNNIFSPYGFSIALMTYLSYAFVVPLILLEKSKNNFSKKLEQELFKKENELQEAHQILIKNEKMANEKDKLVAIGSMSAGISHNFNNSLNVLKQGVRALKFATEKNDKMMVDRILSNMSEVIRISSNIIMSIKGLQKIEDKVKLINLKAFIDTICSLYKGLTFEDINIQNKIQDGMNIETDELHLYNAVANIVKNAIEASLESTKKTIEISAEQDSAIINIDISDFGKGVPESSVTKIFEGSSTKNDGLGYGLKNSKENLKNIDGNLEIIHLKDPTTFRITLRKKHDLSRG